MMHLWHYQFSLILYQSSIGLIPWDLWKYKRKKTLGFFIIQKNHVTGSLITTVKFILQEILLKRVSVSKNAKEIKKCNEGQKVHICYIWVVSDRALDYKRFSCSKTLTWPLKPLFDLRNLCWGYSKESSQWDDSFEYPQHRF